MHSNDPEPSRPVENPLEALRQQALIDYGIRKDFITFFGVAPEDWQPYTGETVQQIIAELAREFGEAK